MVMAQIELLEQPPSSDRSSSDRQAQLAQADMEAEQANLQMKAKLKQTDEVAVLSIPHNDMELNTLIVNAGSTEDDENGKKFFELDYLALEQGFEPTLAPYGMIDEQQRWECPYNKQSKIKDPMYWPADKDLLVRRIVQLPPGVTKMVVKGIVHKAVAIYMNGVAVSGTDEDPFVEPGGLCPSLDNVVVTIPLEEIRTGPSLLAFHVTGAATLNFFDVEVRSYYPRPTGEIGRAYTWGKGYFGVLGNGYEVDNFQPAMTLRPKTLAGKALNKMSMGVAHTLMLLDNGEVYGWGRNQEGQLGPLPDYTEIPVPLEAISAVGKIIDVASGSLHNLILDRDGNVYTFGDNGAGQCGIGEVDGDELATVLEPTRVAGVNDEWFKFIGAKDRHSVAISDSGAVYEWGNGVKAPAFVATVPDVKQLTVGTDHAVVLDKHGTVHIWGTNKVG